MHKRTLMLLGSIIGLASQARADIVTDWNLRTAQFTLDARLSAADANQVVATAGVSVADALTAISGRFSPLVVTLSPARDASVDAAVAAAAHGVLVKMVPNQQTAIEAAYQAALLKIPDSVSKQSGIALGNRAAEAVVSMHANEAGVIESYRPSAIAGKYVPTMLPASLTVSQRKLWLLSSCDQFRPGPPPALDTGIWARDFNEVKTLGRRENSSRSLEETEIARFWEATNPVVFLPVVHAVANMPGRDPVANARLLAVVAMVADEAHTAIFDAKYTYNFWRPVTAIRNGDIDQNEATERDPKWLPLIDTPMHPEYPCAHCIVSAAIGTVLKGALAGAPSPVLTTSSPTAPGKTRSWANPDEFMREVSLARIYDGVHYRNSTEVGAAMGVKIGELATAKYLRP